MKFPQPKLKAAVTIVETMMTVMVMMAAREARRLQSRKSPATANLVPERPRTSYTHTLKPSSRHSLEMRSSQILCCWMVSRFDYSLCAWVVLINLQRR